VKALIAMSGGVDSAMAALLLQQQGYDCVGCTMKLYNNEDAGVDRSKTCCAADDVQDARAMCLRMGIPYYVFNFTYDFRREIIDRFVRCYECGQTPNPCIDCNKYMKFGKLYERAALLDCDVIATGHYARIEERGGVYLLKKAVDETKDQSYVLYSLTQAQLRRTVFPLGSLRKSEVRVMAAEAGLEAAQKPDSQDICFVPDGDYAKIVTLHSGREPEPGPFVNMKGERIGTHRGIIHYTIGQRRGLGIAAERPLYVVSVEPETNTVVLGYNEDLFRREVLVRDFNWCAGIAPEGAFRCSAKIRYRHPEQPAVCVALPDGRVRIVFDEGQRAVTPGQSAVVYDGDVVLGGGIIE